MLRLIAQIRIAPDIDQLQASPGWARDDSGVAVPVGFGRVRVRVVVKLRDKAYGTGLAAALPDVDPGLISDRIRRHVHR